MSKKHNKFADSHEYDDSEWADDFRKDGKRYNAKKENLKFMRSRKLADQDKFFNEGLELVNSKK